MICLACLCQNSALCFSVSPSYYSLSLTMPFGDILLLTSCSIFLHINSNSTIWCLRNTQHKILASEAGQQDSVILHPTPSPFLIIVLSGSTSCLSRSCINSPSCGHSCSQTLQMHALKTRSLLHLMTFTKTKCVRNTVCKCRLERIDILSTFYHISIKKKQPQKQTRLSVT